MDRINGANTVDIGSGRRGFRNRNLGAGLSGTQVDAAFMNALQEEVVGIIEAAGLTPDDGDWGQLLAALGSLYGGAGSLAANGWWKMPGGLIIQWGAVARASRVLSASTVVTFPLAFPNSCWVVIPTLDYDDAGLLDMAPGADAPSLTQVTLLAGTHIASGEGVESRTFGWRWIAIGR